MKIFFSVGEPSGDQHAAHLIEELQRRSRQVDCCGFGGPRMEKSGCRVIYPLTNLAVMGFLRVIPLLWTFFRLVRQADQFFRDERPDAVVLVDFPGFNWWIARRAKRRGIPVFYYLPPQLWAWAPWRIGRVRKFVDHVICALPFEHQWYTERGIRAEYVGHPFFDEVAAHRLDESYCRHWKGTGRRTVALLPGSRTSEVTRNFPVMLETARRLSQRHPDVQFLVACYREEHRELCADVLAESPGNWPIELHLGRTPEIIHLADCCLMVSGSVSLELLARTTPAVVVYSIGRATLFMKNIFVTCKYFTLTNLIADRMVMPEFAFAGDPAPVIAEIVTIFDGWLSSPLELRNQVRELESLRGRWVQTGATERTAGYILRTLGAEAATDTPRQSQAA